MPQMSVEQFASELGMPLAVLLEQLQAAGVSKHLTEDRLTEKDKTQLLEYLQKIHGIKEKSKISLPRRQTSEIKKPDGAGAAGSVQVKGKVKRKVRKKQAKQFSGIIMTRNVGIRLKDPLAAISVEDGLCTGCSRVAPRKMANTNNGTLALCPECTREALRRYKRLLVSNLLPEKKKKKRRPSFVRILQGGAPGLGKRSS